MPPLPGFEIMMESGFSINTGKSELDSDVLMDLNLDILYMLYHNRKL
jgi:hypothetical protein